MLILTGESEQHLEPGTTVDGVLHAEQADRARDAIGELLRQQAVGIDGAQSGWDKVSDVRRETWRKQADPFLRALRKSGFDLVAPRDPDAVDTTGREHWVAAGHRVGFDPDPDPAHLALQLDGATVTEVELYALVEAGISALHEFHAHRISGSRREAVSV